jgi:glycosyltransferase involved in cell wall biosynthesis
MTLIEAMACGTPFVATPVGAISGFRGGIIANSVTSQVKAIVKLLEDPALWQNLSDAGRMQYENEFSYDHISSQLAKAVQAAVSLAPMQT